MFEFSVNLHGLRGFISCIGILGNVFLIIFIIQTKSSHVKSFELFLLGLAAVNLEEIVIKNIYVIIVQTSVTSRWWCHLLKFLSFWGEMSSILFTVIISIYRYQKLRDAKRANLPVCLDSIRYAWMLSGACAMISTLVSVPIFVITLQGSVENITQNSSSCPPDFFECGKNNCPTRYHIYKHLFMLICYLLPLIIVTVSSCLIIMVLLNQEKMVTAVDDVSCPNHHCRKNNSHSLHRSTVAVMAAMWLFQVDWTLYLILQWTLNQVDVPLWVEIEFFIPTSYTSISPYVYGIGNHLFSLRHFKELFFRF